MDGRTDMNVTIRNYQEWYTITSVRSWDNSFGEKSKNKQTKTKQNKKTENTFLNMNETRIILKFLAGSSIQEEVVLIFSFSYRHGNWYIQPWPVPARGFMSNRSVRNMWFGSAVGRISAHTAVHFTLTQLYCAEQLISGSHTDTIEWRTKVDVMVSASHVECSRAAY